MGVLKVFGLRPGGPNTQGGVQDGEKEQRRKNDRSQEASHEEAWRKGSRRQAQGGPKDHVDLRRRRNETRNKGRFTTAFMFGAGMEIADGLRFRQSSVDEHGEPAAIRNYCTPPRAGLRRAGICVTPRLESSCMSRRRSPWGLRSCRFGECSCALGCFKPPSPRSHP
jgi:hypothetical protein